MGEDGGTVELSCDYRVTSKSDVLECSVFGARPAPVVSWFDSETGVAVNDITTSQSDRPDGTYDTTVELRIGILELREDINFTCSATGPAVNGTSSVVVRVTYSISGNHENPSHVVCCYSLKS